MGNLGKNIQLRGSAITNVGQVRSHNEDNVHLRSGENLLLAIVADGMGGAAAGEEASRIAVETISTMLGLDDIQAADEVDIPTDQLQSAVKEANLMIIQEAVQHPSNKGMGTTVTMAFIKHNEARFAHVGDSRAYRVNRDGEIEQITSDHSFVQALVEANHITQEQAETHPMRNVLYRALGQTRELDVDTYYAKLSVGDRLVLCSDGLTGHVRAEEIAKIASASEDPNTISNKLVELANQRGGEDNISVIVILVDEDNQDTQKRQKTGQEQQENRARPPQQQKKPPTLPGTDTHSTAEQRAGQDFNDRHLPGSEREGRGQRGPAERTISHHVIAAEGHDMSYPPQ